MLFQDTYKSPSSSSQGFYKNKGSKFISYVFPVYSEEDVKVKLEEIRKKEYNAQHYCYAYTLYPDKSAWRSNDDGEPANTAGKPILGQIQSKDLTNILIIVTRYFGGIKLGIGGLISAYKTAASNGLDNTIIKQQFIKEIYEVHFTYKQTKDVMKVLKFNFIDILEQNFNEICKIKFAIRKSKADIVSALFKNNYQLKIKYLKTI